MESNSLELLHAVQLDMLVKFDSICSKNHLTYFLDSGTALGAVRHGGFIPWDDDVDIAMPRSDYDRLLQLGEKGLPDNLFVQTYKNDLNYMCPFGKIRLGNSFFPDIDVEKMKFQGIYIDIFPFDKLPQNTYFAKIRIVFSRLLWFFCVFSRREYPGKNIVLKVLSSLLHRLSDRGKLMLFRFYDSFCTRYNRLDSDAWTCYCWNMSQHHVYIFDEKELFPTNTIEFEGKMFKIAYDAHSYLTKMYGDYSVLPALEKRKTHLRNRSFSLYDKSFD